MRTTFATPALAAALAALGGACGEARLAESQPAAGGSCSACHGDASSPAPPAALDGSTATTALGVGAHRSHLRDGSLRRAVACGECHVVPADVAAPGHVDPPPAEVAFGPLARAGGAAPEWRRAEATCSGVYCHGARTRGGSNPAKTVVWTSVGSGQAACGTCHGLPPGDGHPPVSGGLAACNGCHPGTVRPDGAIDVAGGKHIDGQVEATGGHDAAWMDPASGAFHGDAAKQGLASCQSCHGATLDGGFGRACADCHGASWKTSCTMCHGGVDNLTGAPPVDIRDVRDAASVTVGAHTPHVGPGGVSAGFDCGACHVKPADALAVGHIDGSPAEVVWGPLASAGGALSPSWDRGAATCSSTWCHGSTLGSGTNHVPRWTAGASQAACGTCHATRPDLRTGRHQLHVNEENRDCSACHGAGYSPTAVAGAARATHVNGVKDLRADIGWNPASRSCANACHGREGPW